MNFENIIFLGFDFTLIELLALAILWVIVLWSIVMIICILKKVFNILKKFWAEIKENEKKLKSIGLIEDKIKKENGKEEKKNEKEQYEQAIRRILDSESLLIVGKYLTYIIVGFFILLIVAVIGLVLIAKIK